jgi:Cdc6-like AAA superfamily ATPase
MMLIEREKEFELIESLVLNSIGNNDPLSIYISGPPGTGKTATVKALIQKLQQNKRRQKRVIKFFKK